ncbi:MAG: MoxR family ATPase [Ruminococcaceae bacterium]|nr:MoxR family ATPase [Oscillospiraceae bacterium]
MENQMENFANQCERIIQEIQKDLVGQDEVVRDTVTAMIAGGNVLLEGVPGVGKTRLVRSLGQAFSLPFSRIQFTPDLMPADVTGTNVLETYPDGRSAIIFKKGPIFAGIVLADEINRATPKTQSALLEAMQEHKVTVSGVSYTLDEPFFVLATQNPIEQDGTYPLPEAQTDRFMFKLNVEFPTADQLYNIVSITQKTMEETAEAVVTAEDLLAMRACAKEIPIMEPIMRYTMRLVCATHPELPDSPDCAKKYIRFGASPRAAQALITAGKVRALMNGRYNVAFEDIESLAFPVLRHRIKPSYAAVTDKLTPDDCIRKLIQSISQK